ncbi:protein kinase [bacterium]|nr:protein kinase [bacterium]
MSGSEPNNEDSSGSPDSAEQDPRFPPRVADEATTQQGTAEEKLAADAELDDMPREFGRYIVQRKLGTGGMGSVYLALDSKLNRRVALKTPSFARHADETLIKRFMREAQAAATIHHPNVCPVFDLGECEGRYYLTMAYIEGDSLARWVQLQDEIPLETALAIVKGIALGLHAVHEAGIIHRDVKPGNIMMTAAEEPIITDFGMVRLIDASNTVLTPAGAMVGTPGYMAPEQVLFERDLIGPTTDIYGLGVIMYELLTGWPPFSGSLATILGAIVSDPPPTLDCHCPHLDAELSKLCLKALEKDQSKRYQSGQELADAIDAYLRGEVLPSDETPSKSESTDPETPAETANQESFLQRLWNLVARRGD